MFHFNHETATLLQSDTLEILLPADASDEMLFTTARPILRALKIALEGQQAVLENSLNKVGIRWCYCESSSKPFLTLHKDDDCQKLRPAIDLAQLFDSVHEILH